jgi:hypothetical protein
VVYSKKHDDNEKVGYSVSVWDGLEREQFMKIRIREETCFSLFAREVEVVVVGLGC